MKIFSCVDGSEIFVHSTSHVDCPELGRSYRRAELALRRSLLGTWSLNLGLGQSDPDSVPLEYRDRAESWDSRYSLCLLGCGASYDDNNNGH